MKTINYEKELNPAQYKAVSSTEGPYLVIAGAGSGKTRTLVYRVAYLVEKGIKPDEILLLTFTRKAAQEMLRRATALLDERCSRVAGGTFHSFANMTLRKYGYLLGISPGFSILDDADSEDALNLLRTQLGYHKTEKRFPRKGAILEIISKAANKVQPLGQTIAEEFPQFLEWEEDLKKMQQAYAAYKRANQLLDYDDLLLFMRDVLMKHEPVRLALSRKYRYVMVDEYQDTNKLQAQIICLLCSEHSNVMVVGDDSQSIYSFRGANFKNIIDFPKIFKGTVTITLEENYRSTQPVLNLANAVIHQAAEKFEKNLFTRKSGRRMPLFVDARDVYAQAQYIADTILEQREEGIELSEMAVLFRSSWHSNELEVELARRDIPFVKYGGQKFVEAAHIKDMVAYLRIVYNLSDAVSWYRALLLMRGIGPKSAEKILGEVISEKKGFSAESKLIEKHEDAKKLFALLRTLKGQDLRPEELLSVFFEYYQPLLQEKYDDYHKRTNDLESLQRMAARYRSLEAFLTDMALEPPERNIIEAGTRDKDDSRLTLSTIHSAKGLEWSTVFVIYVAEGHLPSYLSLESAEAIEEERRLFYVALTRAKENLFLLKPHIDRSPRGYQDPGGSIFTQISRFLDEDGISENLLEMQSAETEIDDYDDLDHQEPDARKSQEFLELMKQHFRDAEDY